MSSVFYLILLIIIIIVLYFGWGSVFPQQPPSIITPQTQPPTITPTPPIQILPQPPPTNITNVHHTIATRLAWLQINGYIKPTITVNCVVGTFPPTNVNINQFYKNTPCLCEKDDQLYAQYQTAMAPITNFKNQIVNLSNAILWGDATSKDCLSQILLQCVNNKSFLGTMATSQSDLERLYFTINYMIVYATNIELVKNASIESYISQLVSLNSKFSTRTGNIKAWYVLHEFYRYLLLGGPSIDTLYIDQCNIINTDGSITSELARGSRSNEYHAYFAIPMVIIAYGLWKCNSSVYNQPKLHALVNYIVNAYKSQQGTSQQPMSDITPWLKLYTTTFGTSYLTSGTLLQTIKMTNTLNIGNIVYTFVAGN